MPGSSVGTASRSTGRAGGSETGSRRGASVSIFQGARGVLIRRRKLSSTRRSSSARPRGQLPSLKPQPVAVSRPSCAGSTLIAIALYRLKDLRFQELPADDFGGPDDAVALTSSPFDGTDARAVLQTASPISCASTGSPPVNRTKTSIEPVGEGIVTRCPSANDSQVELLVLRHPTRAICRSDRTPAPRTVGSLSAPDVALPVRRPGCHRRVFSVAGRDFIDDALQPVGELRGGCQPVDVVQNQQKASPSPRCSDRS